MRNMPSTVMPHVYQNETWKSLSRKLVVLIERGREFRDGGSNSKYFVHSYFLSTCSACVQSRSTRGKEAVPVPFTLAEAESALPPEKSGEESDWPDKSEEEKWPDGERRAIKGN